jgi:hypothetical protein
MESLLRLLVNFENDKSILTDENDLVKHREIEEFACKLLVNAEGLCNWENIYILRDSDFNVIPIEKDGFGWLIGGIVTKKGIITYG